MLRRWESIAGNLVLTTGWLIDVFNPVVNTKLSSILNMGITSKRELHEAVNINKEKNYERTVQICPLKENCAVYEIQD